MEDLYGVDRGYVDGCRESGSGQQRGAFGGGATMHMRCILYMRCVSVSNIEKEDRKDWRALVYM